jgi:DNA-binding Xre family transcriptional regulator
MAKVTVLSKHKVEVQAVINRMSLVDVNNAAGLGTNYIYRISDYADNLMLSTINRIAAALGCSALDLLEEVEVDEDTQPEALIAVAPVAVFA